MPHGELPFFGESDLVRLFSSPSSVVGERCCVRGRVHTMRGLSIGDGLVLGILRQDGSRFEVLRQIGAVEKPMSLTVMTTHVEHTRAAPARVDRADRSHTRDSRGRCQEAWRGGSRRSSRIRDPAQVASVEADPWRQVVCAK
jgi:hypothetical protein